MSLHIIHKQKVILNINSMDDAFNYQNTVSKLFANGLSTAIEQLLDELDTPNTVTRIDELKVDLGEIIGSGFNQQFKDKLLDGLKNSITTAQRNPGKNATIIKQSASLKDGFIHFIKRGTFPWYIEAKNMAAFEACLFSTWNDADWKSITDWLQDNFGKTIIERLVWQFSNNFLKQILSTSLSEVIDDQNCLMLLNDLQYLNNRLENKNQSSKEFLTQTFSFVFHANKSYSLNTLIADQILEAVKNENASFNKYYDDIVSNIKTDIITTIVNNIEFLLEKQVSLNHVSANDILIKDKEKLNEILISDHLNETQAGKKIESSKSLKNKNKSLADDTEPLVIHNCGIVLLHPFLQSYFEELLLIRNKSFVSDDAQKKCILLLHYLSTGINEAEEFDLALEKILCGYALEETLPTTINLTQQQIDESAKLLEIVINYWSPLKNTSAEGLQKTFLQREGKLGAKENGWQLTIEQKTVDILLNKLPWGFSTIKLPWMKDMLSVNWC
ncbi:MAG: contractile injection system tape measure protein [Parafilimonas sp.]